MTFTRFDPAGLDPREVARRRDRLVTLVIVLAAPAVATMADLHGRTGFDAWKLTHLALFFILFSLLALGAAQSLIGFFVRHRGGDPLVITADSDATADDSPVLARVAIVMPICNEDVGRVIEGLRVMVRSLDADGRLPYSDFFLLSDSTDPNCWIAEEAAWLALTEQLGAHGRFFYRKRRLGINKKAGNLADFCRRWGGLYRYMIVLDADSVMAGDTMVRLVRTMERHPRVGLVQGVPVLVNGATVLARLQQFASRLYGPVAAAGLNFWALGEANYWGHNAILRLAPFIRHCSLPELSGSGPFGGRILSHDYVEAALMRRAGWQVWLAPDLAGNYEECPGDLLAFAQRDRRWLQGNLQHASLVFARGFHTVNRLHLALGILAFLASPLWLAFLVISVVIATGHPSAAPGPGAGGAGQALALFAFTLALLFLPKALALLDLRARPAEVAAFGGWRTLLGGVALESVLFTLLAPVLMLCHTWFIGLTLCRQNVAWGRQRRGTVGASALMETVTALWLPTVLGLVGAAVVWQIAPALAGWMSPILAGLILSVPLAYFNGSLPTGAFVRARGLFSTPEETHPTPELAQLTAALVTRHQRPHPADDLQAHYGLLQAVLDPYVNAVHVALLREKDDPPPANEVRFAALRDTLLHRGPAALAPGDRLALLLDVDSMHALHTTVWATPSAQLAGWWQLALHHYTRLAIAPRTAFNS